MANSLPPVRWREQLLQWTAPPPEDADSAPSSADGWRQHADRFRAVNQVMRGREEPFIRFLSPWLSPDISVIDVGAGGGRFTAPLAERARAVVAVEPSAGMREVLAEAVAGRSNVRIVPRPWPNALADVQPADLVVSANVAYDVPDLAPFIQALDQAARHFAALFLTLTHPVGAMAPLWRQFRGWTVPSGPTYLDAAAVAFHLGLPVNVTLVPVQPTLVFPDWDAALALYRHRLGLRPDAQRDVELQAALAPMMAEEAERLVVRPRERHAAVIWWEKG
ncbi:MAG: methyltransferase domain-containing protein [Anaerolineae bacterium]|nr:methyltransferase domain-containing protein [Anaerolineae bacterium]